MEGTCAGVGYMVGPTFGPPPARDAAGVIGLEQLLGPGYADGPDSWVVLQTLVRERQLLQFDQSDVVLIGGGDIAEGRRRTLAVLPALRYILMSGCFWDKFLPWVDADVFNRNNICGTLRSMFPPERKLYSEGRRIRSGGEMLDLIQLTSTQYMDDHWLGPRVSKDGNKEFLTVLGDI